VPQTYDLPPEFDLFHPYEEAQVASDRTHDQAEYWVDEQLYPFAEGWRIGRAADLPRRADAEAGVGAEGAY
jgi:hypothetical protein